MRDQPVKFIVELAERHGTGPYGMETLPIFIIGGHRIGIDVQENCPSR